MPLRLLRTSGRCIGRVDAFDADRRVAEETGDLRDAFGMQYAKADANDALLHRDP